MNTIIRNGTLVDGTGASPKAADILIENGKIAQIAAPGSLEASSADVIDASGKYVTPGFVDPHTHYDGQATWDSELAPSSHHGVTTVVMGNCGVGFAPARPHERQYLIELMEGVEDIPGTALNDGIQWDWESFPEYLDALEKKTRAVDIATQLPHGPLRLFAFGQDSNVNAPANRKQIDLMAGIARDAAKAGAFAFSTNRIAMHVSLNGESVPGTFAEKDEVLAIAKATREGGASLIQIVPQGLMGEDPAGYAREVALYREISAESGCTVYFTLAENNVEPEHWRGIMDDVDKANRNGAHLVAAISNRPGGILMSWDSFNIFIDRPGFQEIAKLPLKERVKMLRDPKRRERILNEAPTTQQLRNAIGVVTHAIGSTYFLQGALDLEPDPASNFAHHLAKSGKPMEHVMYDALCDLAEGAAGDDETGFLHIYMGGYAKGNLDVIGELMSHPNTVIGAADGGAHVNVICDASYPSYMLQHWVRDRARGPRMPIETAIKKLSGDPAALYGFNDRGTLAAGKRADLNIIDLTNLELQLPRVVRDLPTGAPRLLQEVNGIDVTMLAGVPTFKSGVATGAHPGRLLRRKA